MAVRLRRKIPIRKRIQRKVEDNKTLTVVSLVYIVSLIFGSLADILTEFNGILAKPYQFLSGWEYKEKWFPWIHFNLMFWPVFGVVWLLRSLVLFLWRKYVIRMDEETVAPLVLYKEEFAAAVEAIDQVNDDLPADEALKELLLTVAETISVNLGLRKKDYRMLFFVPFETPKGIEIAGFRLGKHFELVEAGRLDPKTFYLKDLKVIDFCLEQESTDLVIPNMPGDAKTVLFARNPGKFRLGLFIAVLKNNFDIDMAKEVFPQVSHIITTLGFMDEMIDFIVQYDLEGGDIGVETQE